MVQKGLPQEQLCMMVQKGLPQEQLCGLPNYMPYKFFSQTKLYISNNQISYGQSIVLITCYKIK